MYKYIYMYIYAHVYVYIYAYIYTICIYIRIYIYDVRQQIQLFRTPHGIATISSSKYVYVYIIDACSYTPSKWCLVPTVVCFCKFNSSARRTALRPYPSRSPRLSNCRFRFNWSSSIAILIFWRSLEYVFLTALTCAPKRSWNQHVCACVYVYICICIHQKRLRSVCVCACIYI